MSEIGGLAPDLRRAPVLALTFLLLLLTACHTEDNSRPWTQTQVLSSHKNSASSKLTLPAADPIYGLTFELIHTQEGTKGYLIAHSTPIRATSSLPIHYTINNNPSTTTEGHLLQGGQKVLLPDTLTQEIIAALQNDQTIHLSLPGYATTLHNHNFTPQLHALLHPKTTSNPFRLPF